MVLFPLLQLKGPRQQTPWNRSAHLPKDRALLQLLALSSTEASSHEVRLLPFFILILKKEVKQFTVLGGISLEPNY